MNFYTLNRGLYKRLHKYFSYKATQYSYRKEVREKIKRLNCKPLTHKQKLEIKEYYKSFGFKNISTDWHRLYTHISGKFYKEYIPEDFFYNVVEPSLNMKVMFPALTDKNLMDKLFYGIKQPKTIIKNVNGNFIEGVSGRFIDYDLALKKCNKYSSLVIKPSIDSGGGKDVNILKLKDGIVDVYGTTLDQILKQYGENFIVQELLVQHEQMSLLNPDSVNTIRFKTIHINREVLNMYPVVRVGSKGSRVDNASQGGFFCKINNEGKLDEKGYFSSGKCTKETDTGVILKEFQIPYFEQITKKVIELHGQVPHFNMISWDIAIGIDSDPILIEYNILGQGFSEEWGPIFGNYTSEVLSKCKFKLFTD